MIKAILFDVDGVLALGEPWGKKLAEAYGITQNMLDPFFNGPFQACLIGKADLKNELVPYLARWGWQQSPTAFLDAWFRHEAVINTPLIQTVQHLRQCSIKCYLATQQERYRTEYILHEMHFASLFDGMFCSVDIGYMKNNPAFFETILYKLDEYKAEQILFWDDAPKNVETARNVGIQAEIYNNFANFTQKMQKYNLDIHAS